jgi:hypothetical protein
LGLLSVILIAVVAGVILTRNSGQSIPQNASYLPEEIKTTSDLAQIATSVPEVSPTPAYVLPATWTPTITLPPTIRSSPTQTPIPTSTPRPIKISTFTPAVDQAVVSYLKKIAVYDKRLRAIFLGNTSVPHETCYNDLKALSDELDKFSVPEKAKPSHTAFQLATISLAKIYLDWVDAEMFPNQSAYYLDLANIDNQTFTNSYFHKYIPWRDELLRSVNMSAKDAGFE